MPSIEKKHALSIIAVAIAALLAGTHDTARAQAYPARPIHFIVAYAAGGGADFVGRIFTRKLAETWNQPIIVENRPGGGSNIGAERGVARSGEACGHPSLLWTLSIGGKMIGRCQVLVPMRHYGCSKP